MSGISLTIGSVKYSVTCVSVSGAIWQATGPKGGALMLVRNQKRPELFAVMRGARTLGWYRMEGATLVALEA